jgi:hypothetical protein
LERQLDEADYKRFGSDFELLWEQNSGFYKEKVIKSD